MDLTHLDVPSLEELSSLLCLGSFTTQQETSLKMLTSVTDRVHQPSTNQITTSIKPAGTARQPLAALSGQQHRDWFNTMSGCITNAPVMTTSGASPCTTTHYRPEVTTSQVAAPTYHRPEFTSSQVAAKVKEAFPEPLSLRIAMLNLQLLTLESKQKTRSQEIQNYYAMQASQLEGRRYQALSAHGVSPWQYDGINSYYDNQHSILISQVQQWCHQVEAGHVTGLTEVAAAPAIRQRKAKPAKLNPVATRIMENWYSMNEEHPYPTAETTEYLATTGGITTEQVRKWFANRRLRSGNTKTTREIARRRKCPLAATC